MNKKSKHKKSKNPNPSPSQEQTGETVKSAQKCDNFPTIIATLEVVENPLEKCENVEENIDVKDERVPEIVSETVTPSVETKDEETPKKPRRNRGKKKKGNESDFEETLEDKPSESDIIEITEETKPDVTKDDIKSEDTTPITASTRKKKNKKKNPESKPEESNIQEQEQKPSPLPTIENIISEPEVSDLKQDFTKTETTEESKQSKKKNKKKKRHDSERSDKQEGSCTSALDDFSKSVETPMEIKSLDEPSAKTESNISECQIQQKPEEIIPSPVLLAAKTPLPSTDTEEIKETVSSETKGKKKNKKDKKNKPEEITQPPPDVMQQDIKQEVIALPFKESQKEDAKESVVQQEKVEKIDESPKLKAKIAKPVEKKRKGKHDGKNETVPIEKGQEIETTLPSTADVPETHIFEQQEVSEKPLKSESERNIPEMPTETVPIMEILEQDIEGTPQEFEEFKSITKKKKKPKTSKTTEVVGQETEEINKDIIKPTDTQESSEKLPSVGDVTLSSVKTDPISDEFSKSISLGMILESKRSVKAKEEKKSEVEKPHLLDLILESKDMAQSKPEEKKDKILLTPETNIEVFPEIEVTKSQSSEHLKVDTKPGKKRKKSPKPQKQAEVSEPKVDILKDLTPSPEELPKTREQSGISDQFKMSNVEISSVKAEESEGSVSDVIPDVIYPRSMSQQLPDDNNNTTFIREVLPIEVMPSVVLTSEPLKAEMTSDKKEDTKHIKAKEEKTDIKSKMMEVNKDMEGLRLSIERSLAELTSMEQSEKEVEKQFEESKKTEDLSKTEKQKEPEDIKNIDIGESFIGEPLERVIMAAAIGDRSKIMTPTEEKCTTPSKPEPEVSQTPPILEDIPKNNQAKELLSAISKTEQSNIPEVGAMLFEETKTDKVKQEIDICPTMEAIRSDIIEKDLEVAGKAVESKEKGKKKKKGPKMPTMSDIGPEIAPSSIKKLESNVEPESKKELPASEVFLTPIIAPQEKNIETLEQNIPTEFKLREEITTESPPPIAPAKRSNKNKDKKKKGKQEATGATVSTQSTSTTSQTQQSTQETKKDEKTDNKNESKSESKGTKDSNQDKGKQKDSETGVTTQDDLFTNVDYEPIDNFEDALTSSVDDVNKTFEIIVQESQEQKKNPKINVIAPDEEKTPVSPPKNLLGHPDIPVPSSRRDYKKEKDKIPNEVTATVNVKDSVEIEKKQSKNTQTITKMRDLSKQNVNEEFVYKYNFRKVFLQSACHVCKKELCGVRVPCNYCNLLFYCSVKHKDEDWPQHQALCFAISTIVHLKDQKHIYGDAKNIIGHDYRLIRMQMIVSCEKVLKRRLVPWEQEALLYPRICAHVPCREWRQSRLTDCQGCGQISYCLDNPDHLPKTHSRWCKSYSLYQKLVCYQQTSGRLEPKLPTKVMEKQYQISDKINEVLASMYEEKIDMSDIQYAALTQLATAPLTAAYCHQAYRNKCGSTNGVYKKSSFTIHVVGAELQFEADALNKWEVFFLHLRPDLQELRVVLVNYNLNPSNLPLDLLGKIKLCDICRQKKRRVVFSFQDKKTYVDYKTGDDFVNPDLVCAFNPSIQRSSIYNGKDPWPTTTNAILKLKAPFLITAYTMTELHKDCIRIKESNEIGYNFTIEPRYNPFASVRPDRNFISDDEIPLLFKNYCFAVISG